MTEEEEFEFRARLEREQGAATPPPMSDLSDPSVFRAAAVRRAQEGPQWGEGFAKLVDKFAYGAGEKVTDATGSPAAGYATNVIAQAIPTLLTGGAAKTAGGPLMEKAAQSVMQSAIKPTSKALVNGDAARAIDTMLQEGVNATAAGAAKLRILISNLKAEVGKVISQSPAEVNRGHAYRELASALDDVTKKGAGYTADRTAVLKAWEEFKNHPLLDKFAEVGDMIPIQVADTVKRASQKAAESAYGALTPPTAADKAQQAIAAGMRKGMEEAEPAVGAMNAKLSEYINALQQIEPRAAAAANRDLGGLVPLAGSPEAAMLMLADRNPWMKSLIARVLYAGRERVPEAAGQAAAAALVSGQGTQ
jgi:hypothetical protein